MQSGHGATSGKRNLWFAVKRRAYSMSLDNITALVWIFVAGYALSVLQSIKRTSDFVKTEVQKMCEEEKR